MHLPVHDPLAISIVGMIRSGQTEELARTLAGNPALARAVIVDAKGHGRTLLHVATDWPGHFPEVGRTIAMLIAAGADVNARFIGAEGDGPPATPLHWAASSGDVVALDALLDAGADIEAPGAAFTGGAPMSDAVIFAQWNAARRLLARGASTTLTQAAALGLVDRVRDQFARHVPPAQEVTAALWHACRGGALETAMILLERGGDVNWIGWDHRTALDVAEQSGNLELAGWLRVKGGEKSGGLTL